MTRVGIGYDVHRFDTDRPLVLGGVRIPSDRGLAGHSDADVLIHAVVDALLGAAALGDIGTHFPDSDERWRGVDSRMLLAHSLTLVTAAGYRIVNIDCSVALEAPRLAPHVPDMRAELARVLEMDVTAVSIKATTGEGMGFVGRGEGAAAWAVCALESTQGTG